MMRPVALAVLCGTSLLATSAVAQRRAVVPAVAIVTTGSEQAVRVGRTTLSRPFGATLVDRLAVAGTTRGAGVTYYLIRGEAAGECPAHFVVVTAPRRGAPAVSQTFGTCSAAATARLERGTLVVAMPAAAAGGPVVRFRAQAGQMRPIDAVAATSAVAARGAPFGCETPASVPGMAQEDVLVAFERDYPAAYRRPSELKRTDIAPDDLRATVAELACVAQWPGAERMVPEAATPLFSSKRYGRAAFAMIDTIATDPAADANLRAAVRAFGAEMLYRVDRREPL